jgi:hypothetical protein
MKAVLLESGREFPPANPDRGFLTASHDQQSSPLVALRVESLSKRYGAYVEAVGG